MLKGVVAVTLTIILIAITALFISTSILRKHNNSIVRIPSNVVAIFSEAKNLNPRANECGSKLTNSCKYGGASLGAIVIGDSHASSLMNIIGTILSSNELHALDWSMSGCPTFKNGLLTDKNKKTCSSFIKTKLEEGMSLNRNKPLIIINRTSLYFFGENQSKNIYQIPNNQLIKMREDLISTACKFAETRPVYMLRPIPEMQENVPNAMGKALWHTGKYREVSITLEEYHTRHSFVWKAQDEAAERCGIKIINPLPYLCREGKCTADINGLPIYSDDDHLNERGGRLLIPLFKSILSEY